MANVMGTPENLKPWPKGVSGNPGGRPKRILTEQLLRKLTGKKAKELAAAIIAEAEKGNVPAWQEVANRVEGKVAERVELEVTGLAERIARSRNRLSEDITEVVDAAIIRPLPEPSE